MRVCIVGPVAPYRSGIARHTTALARELARRPGVAVSVLSFARQFPSLLYPGEGDRDAHAGPPAGIATKFALDALRPRTWRTAARQILEQRPDCAVVPSWTFALAPCLGFVARALRQGGVPVVMIVHNAQDHEGAWWKRRLSRFQMRQATRFITHNAALARELEALVPGTPTCVRPHPAYDDYPEAEGRLPRTAALELLFFGLVRGYKGLDVALLALAAADLPDVRLAVVGEFWETRGETEALIRELGLADRVELVPRYVSDAEAAEYFARCDAVMAPYRSASGSGVVALAQGYRRPVIASDAPGLAAAVRDGSTGWLHPAGDVAALAALLRTRVTRAAAEAMQPALEAERAELSWARFADAVVGEPAGRTA